MFVRQNYIGRDRGGGLMVIEANVLISVTADLFAPGLLFSRFDAMCPATFAEAANGVVLIANGINPMLRWDGVTRTAIPAGVLPPDVAPYFDGEGGTEPPAGSSETLTFDFTFHGRKVTPASQKARQDAWDRYADRIIATANASTTDTPATALFKFRRFFFGNTGANASQPNQLPLPGQWHFLTFAISLLYVADPDAEVELIDGRYVAFQRFRDRFGCYSNPSPLSSDYLIEDATQINYTNVVIPIEERVRNGGVRQLWRTAAGEAQTFFKDHETTDMDLTEFTSFKNDTELELQEAVAAISNDGDFLIGVHGVPPNDKPFVGGAQNVMLAAGDRVWHKGMVSVTFGSNIVTGIGTGWLTTFEGRFFYTPGIREGIEIVTVDPVAQTLELLSEYQGATDAFLPYAIKSDATSSNVRFTEPSLPESWSIINAIDINEENDEQTGVVTYQGYAYLTKRRSLHRIAFEYTDLSVPTAFPVVKRGAASQGCCVEADGVLFILDELGIHAFDGNGTQHISGPIQDLWRPDGDGFRIFWGHACRFHGVHTPDRHLIRWFVTLSDVERPRHAICFHYRLQRWWIEEFPTAITASVLATVGGRLRPIVALGDGSLCALDVGALDLVDATAGTTRFSPTAVGLCSVTTDESIPSCVGSTLCIVDGQGRGQWRIISSVTSGVIEVDQPWLEIPATTSTCQIGGIHWSWVSGSFHRAWSQKSGGGGVELHFRPTTDESLIEVRTYLDGSLTSQRQADDMQSDNVSATAGDLTLMVQLKRPNQDPDVEEQRPVGCAKIQRSFWKDPNLPILNEVELELAGFSGTEKTVIREIQIPGAQSKG